MNVAGVGEGSGYGGLPGDVPAGSPAAPLRGGGEQAGGFGGDVFEPSVTGMEAEVGTAELGRIRAALTQIVEMSPVSEGEADPIRGVLRQVEAALGVTPAKATGVTAAWGSKAAEDGQVVKLFPEEQPSVLDAALVKLAVYEKAAPGLGETAAEGARVGAQPETSLATNSLVASNLGAAEAALLASQFELGRRVQPGWQSGVLERPRLVGRPGLAVGDGRRRRRSRQATARTGERRKRERRGRVGLAAFCAAVVKAGLQWWRGLIGNGQHEQERRGFASGYRGEE